MTATLITAGALCPGKAGPSQVCGSRLGGGPSQPALEVEGVSLHPSPPGAAFVCPGFLRPGAGGTESQIHINGGQRGEEERIIIWL